MATLHHDYAGHSLMCVKGVPEEVLAMCGYQRSLGEDRLIQRDFWHTKIQEASATGQRVLAMASRVVQAKQQTLVFPMLKRDLRCLDWLELLIRHVEKPLLGCNNAIRQVFSSKSLPAITELPLVLLVQN